VIEQHRLLITRFEPHGRELVEQLHTIGCFAIAQPLLTVTALHDVARRDLFLSGYYDFVIAVSGNAIQFAQQQINSRWPDATYLAVGRSTQQQLMLAASQPVFCPDSRFDSEGLLALKQLQSVQSKRILILRGEGGRDLLETRLTERGAKVDYFQTYKRIKINLNGHELVKNWQQALINGVIISSAEILNQLFALVPNKDASWLCELIFYVPSQRVAEQAYVLGAKHVVLLPSLHTQHIVEFFQS
jgi:uroporphyrinogen-III synthase